MFTFRKRGGGNKYTLIAILMILVIVYVLKLVSPEKEAAYPDIIRYDGFKYKYTETIKGSSLMFARSKPSSAEGFLILSRRGVSATEEIYIYESYKKYRRYVVYE